MIYLAGVIIAVMACAYAFGYGVGMLYEVGMRRASKRFRK